MKICWDMLEGVHLTRNDTFRKGRVSYVYKEVCEKCGEPYLTPSHNRSNFCSVSCSKVGSKWSEEHRRERSKAFMGRSLSKSTRKKISVAMTGKNNPMYGRKHTAKSKEKMSKNKKSQVGNLNPNYKGGIHISGLTMYDTYKDRLKPYEEIRKQKGTEILEVKCIYCGRWFAPTYDAVDRRLAAINNLGKGESSLYCSTNCKLACPTYRRIKYPRGFKHTTSREVSTYLRQIVLKRDNWTCQICGKTTKESQLHVHHMDPVAQNQMFQNDMDSCITLCKGCHKMVHSRRGCRYVDLQCKEKAADQHSVKGYGVS